MLYGLGGMSQTKQRDSTTQLKEVLLDAKMTKPGDLGIAVYSQLRKETLTKLSPVDLAAALNQLPGIFVLSGALNTNRVTMRGVGARTPYGTDKLRLYSNNIPLTNGSGVSSLATLDLENLHGVTVIKGPKATAYGSNLGGAIVLQRDQASVHGTSLSNSFTLGAYGLFKHNFKVDFNDAQQVLSVQYGLLNSDGYRMNSEFKRQNLQLDYRIQITEKDQIGLLFDQVNYTAHIASSLSESAAAENPRQAAFTWAAAKGYEKNAYSLVGLNYQRKFKPAHTLNTSIFYNYLDHYEPRPFNILEEFTHGYGIRSVFNGELKWRTKQLQYTIGAELYEDRYAWRTFANLYADNNGEGSLEGDQLSDQKEHRTQYFAFANMTYPFSEQWQLMLGVNYNKTSYAFRDVFTTAEEAVSAKRNFDGIVSPSLSLRYQLAPTVQLNVNVSRGFSNPGLEETLTPEGTVNPEIKQETGTNYELAFTTSWLQQTLFFNGAIYQMNIENLLVAQRIGDDQYLGKNAGKTKHQGVELALEYHAPLSRNWHVLPQLSYELTQHRFVEFIDFDQDYSGNPLTGVPKHRMNASLTLRHSKGVYLHVNQQYVGEIPLNDANTITSSSFSIIKAKLGYQFEIMPRLAAHVYVGVNNIGDTRYARSVLINAVGFGTAEPRYYYPGEGRNAYAGIHLNYKL